MHENAIAVYHRESLILQLFEIDNSRISRIILSFLYGILTVVILE